MTTIGKDDPDFPPDLPVTGECVAEHTAAMNRYHEMKKAESDAVNAAKKARDRAATAAVACAAGQAAGPLVGFGACVAGVGATIDAVNDLKAKNDLYGIAIQIYSEEKQKLSDCINASGFVIELD
jgi:hypothetical protein